MRTFASEFLCSAVRTLFGTTVHALGFDPTSERQRLFFANHTSHLDTLLIWAALPYRIRSSTRPVAARDYWGSGRVRAYCSQELFHAILIDRKRVTPDADPLAPVHQALRNGSSVIFFPEGTRSTDGTLTKFRSGLFRLATAHPAVELVPVYLHNLNRILPKGEVLPVPLLSRVVFGSCLERITEEDRESFLQRAEISIRRMMP